MLYAKPILIDPHPNALQRSLKSILLMFDQDANIIPETVFEYNAHIFQSIIFSIICDVK